MFQMRGPGGIVGFELWGGLDSARLAHACCSHGHGQWNYEAHNHDQSDSALSPINSELPQKMQTFRELGTFPRIKLSRFLRRRRMNGSAVEISRAGSPPGGAIDRFTAPQKTRRRLETTCITLLACFVSSGTLTLATRLTIGCPIGAVMRYEPRSRKRDLMNADRRRYKRIVL